MTETKNIDLGEINNTRGVIKTRIKADVIEFLVEGKVITRYKIIISAGDIYLKKIK